MGAQKIKSGIDMEEIFRFLKELRRHNDREWFHANKALYLEVKARHEKFIDNIIRELAKVDGEVDGLTAKDCIFRIYRDTRFSLDKSPYKTHIGAFIAKGGRMSPRGGYYVHLEPGASLLSGGIWCPPPALLKALRMDIYGNVEEFSEILHEPEFSKYYHLDGEKLKKVPAPFPKDFPQADWLKYKYYVVTCNEKDSFFEGDGAVDRIVKRLSLILPFNRFLNYTVDESWHGGE